MSLNKPCSYCGYHCDFDDTKEIISMVEINKLKRRYKDTKSGVMCSDNCEFCGTVNIRWTDEKIKCGYCGELL